MNDWLDLAVKPLDSAIYEQALAHQAVLTKPPKALGQLEDIAVHFAQMQGTVKPKLDKVHISVFAADHGVADEGVSAFPQAVTAEMVKNFVRGGAAISVLADYYQATFEIIDVGVKDFAEMDGVISHRAGNGTANFAKQSAMSRDELNIALQAGAEAAQRASESDCFVAGEMGIANTSSATAMACLLLNKSPQQLTGAGTGLDNAGIQHKAGVIEQALALHHSLDSEDKFAVLQAVGGFEIAAMVGAYLRCAQLGVPIIVDGFISTAAALQAIHINKDVQNWMLFAHTSAEQGHRILLEALQAQAILNLNMRLGEGSGAATAIAIIQQAIALHNNMATFTEAGVSEKA